MLVHLSMQDMKQDVWCVRSGGGIFMVATSARCSHCSHVPQQDNKITREMAPPSPALLLLASWLLVAVAGHYNPLVSVCPGEGGSLFCTVLYCTVLHCVQGKEGQET